MVIADDHALVRRGTREILERSGWVDVVGEAADGIEAVELVETLRPDVALIDVTMPRLDGVDAAREIRKSVPDARIVMLTVHAETDHLFRTIGIGVAGYVLKSAPEEVLVDAVLTVAAGGSFLDPSVTHVVLERLRLVGSASAQGGRGTGAEGRPALTSREVETLALTAKGLTNREIAARLEVSPRTIEAHLYSLYSKLGVSSRTEAVIEAIRLGLVDVE